MRGKYQRLCSTAASFLSMNAIVFLPTATQSCCWGWGGGRGLWARLQVRGYLFSAVGTPQWKNCSSGVMVKLMVMLMVLTWPCRLVWMPIKCCCRMMEALGLRAGMSPGTEQEVLT